MAHKELDLDEWELIPNDGFLGFREDCEKKILMRKWSGTSASDPDGVLNDYFDNRPGRLLPQRVPSQLVPVSIPIPIQLSSSTATRVKTPDDGNLGGGVAAGGGGFETDQESVSKVSFKKMKKENEFVDMKMVESPKSPTRGGAFMPQMDAAVFSFDDKVESENMISSPRMKKRIGNLDMKEDLMNNTDEHGDGDEGEEDEDEEEDDDDDDGLNLWKWSLSGIGAICSFGIAAATVCILFIGSHHRNQQHNHKIRFQIYNDDKRMNQVVHQTTKLNEAMNAVRGMPLTRAHVTYGGYYEGL